MNDEELSQRLRRHATRHAAPESLRARVRTQAALHRAAQAAAAPSAAVRWRAAVAGLAAGVALALGLPFAWRHLLPAEPGAAEVVALHVQALAAGPRVDVTSTDRHTVKPWFQGRVDFAPPVHDLAAEGFVLEGGRVQDVAGRRAAVLVFRHRLHWVELYVWPAAGEATPVALRERGFALRSWRQDGLQLWLVADADEATMARFVEAWKAAPS